MTYITATGRFFYIEGGLPEHGAWHKGLEWFAAGTQIGPMWVSATENYFLLQCE